MRLTRNPSSKPSTTTRRASACSITARAASLPASQPPTALSPRPGWTAHTHHVRSRRSNEPPRPAWCLALPQHRARLTGARGAVEERLLDDGRVVLGGGAAFDVATDRERRGGRRLADRPPRGLSPRAGSSRLAAAAAFELAMRAPRDGMGAAGVRLAGGWWYSLPTAAASRRGGREGVRGWCAGWGGDWAEAGETARGAAVGWRRCVRGWLSLRRAGPDWARWECRCGHPLTYVRCWYAAALARGWCWGLCNGMEWLGETVERLGCIRTLACVTRILLSTFEVVRAGLIGRNAGCRACSYYMHTCVRSDPSHVVHLDDEKRYVNLSSRLGMRLAFAHNVYSNINSVTSVYG